MKTNVLKSVAAIAGLSALALVCTVGVRAEQEKGAPGTRVVSTNWVGCLVSGTDDNFDSIAPGPHPTAKREIEIGLRSDGVVIWRRATPANVR